MAVETNLYTLKNLSPVDYQRLLLTAPQPKFFKVYFYPDGCNPPQGWGQEEMNHYLKRCDKFNVKPMMQYRLHAKWRENGHEWGFVPELYRGLSSMYVYEDPMEGWCSDMSTEMVCRITAGQLRNQLYQEIRIKANSDDEVKAAFEQIIKLILEIDKYRLALGNIGFTRYVHDNGRHFDNQLGDTWVNFGDQYLLRYHPCYQNQIPGSKSNLFNNVEVHSREQSADLVIGKGLDHQKAQQLKDWFLQIPH